MATLTAARIAMVCNNLLFAIMAYVADYNETHIFNPLWPPHAKFHNGQSMSFGLLASLTAVYLLVRQTESKAMAKDSVFIAAIVGSLTTTAGLSAIFYPNTAWTDPQWDNGAVIGFQAYIFMGQLLINWGCYYSEKKRLDKLVKEE